MPFNDTSFAVSTPPTVAQIVDGVWDELIADARVALGYGQRIKDAVGLDSLTAVRVTNLTNLNTTITSRASQIDTIVFGDS